MGRRGNPYDNAKAESFMKTLKVEEIYLMEYETFDDVAGRIKNILGEHFGTNGGGDTRRSAKCGPRF
jgi:putative transposase